MSTVNADGDDGFWQIREMSLNPHSYLEMHFVRCAGIFKNEVTSLLKILSLLTKKVLQLKTLIIKFWVEGLTVVF